ncbi:protein lin-52 homolog isoform X1 [Rhipicephalus sanguineus]|uniref:protein lin-52 homolog isoform X1 n=1 Tax=Rhipicephalus sanguineus TaxID=34632 RepID=UPI001895733C|nr:protein lin-52 homolog isoform X1 [Rhipicephalus sanguineus]
MASCSNGDDSEMALLSEEQLDGRLSPDLWPEAIPGVMEFAALLSPAHTRSTKPKWALDEDGLVMLQELGSLTAAALLEKVKDLQNLAYKLGIEESREMTRGRFLDILRKDKEEEQEVLVCNEDKKCLEWRLCIW